MWPGHWKILCESYHIEIENLPAYRPDLKGVVEKLFDLVQSAYKPLLKGKGVIESDTQERGAPDYRRQGTLDLEQFTLSFFAVFCFTIQNLYRQVLLALQP